MPVERSVKHLDLHRALLLIVKHHKHLLQLHRIRSQPWEPDWGAASSHTDIFTRANRVRIVSAEPFSNTQFFRKYQVTFGYKMRVQGVRSKKFTVRVYSDRYGNVRAIRCSCDECQSGRICPYIVRGIQGFLDKVDNCSDQFLQGAAQSFQGGGNSENLSEVDTNVDGSDIDDDNPHVLDSSTHDLESASRFDEDKDDPGFDDDDFGEIISCEAKCIALDLQYSMYSEAYIGTAVFDGYDIPGVDDEEQPDLVEMSPQAILSPSARLKQVSTQTANLRNQLQCLLNADNYYPHSWDSMCLRFVRSNRHSNSDFSLLKLLKIAVDSVADGQQSAEQFVSPEQYQTVRLATRERVAVEADRRGPDVLLQESNPNIVHALKVSSVWNELKRMLKLILDILDAILETSRKDYLMSSFTRRLGIFQNSIRRIPIEIDEIVGRRMVFGLVKLVEVVKNQLYSSGILQHPLVRAELRNENIRQIRW